MPMPDWLQRAVAPDYSQPAREWQKILRNRSRLVYGQAGEPVRLTLGDNLFAIVDYSDAEAVGHFAWFIRRNGSAGRYVLRAGLPREGKRTVSLTRYLTQCPDHLVVDHINGDTLDNRRGNLRVCTLAENGRNRRIARDNITGYVGITLQHGKYNTFCQGAYLGRFADPVEGALAYDAEARRRYGAFARLNFPAPGEQSV